MKKKYVVELTNAERQRLRKLPSAGTAPARMLTRARILLEADVGEHAGDHPALLDREIAGMLGTSRATVGRVRERFCRQGSTPRSSAPCPMIGRTGALWTGAPRPG